MDIRASQFDVEELTALCCCPSQGRRCTVGLLVDELRIAVIASAAWHRETFLRISILNEESFEGAHQDVIIISTVGIIAVIIVWAAFNPPVELIGLFQTALRHVVVGGIWVAHEVPSPVFGLAGGIIGQRDGARGGKDVVLLSIINGREGKMTIGTAPGSICVHEESLAGLNSLVRSYLLPVAAILSTGTLG